MAGIKTVETFVTPRITSAAQAAGRPAPRVAVGLPVAVCDDAKTGKAVAAETFKNYLNSPHYRRLVDREGGSIEDIAVCGDEKTVESQLRALAAAGATHLYAYAVPVGDNAAASIARTHELLTSLVGKID